MLDSSKKQTKQEKHLKTKRLRVFFFNLQTAFDSDYVRQTPYTHGGISKNVFWIFIRQNWRNAYDDDTRRVRTDRCTRYFKFKYVNTKIRDGIARNELSGKMSL